MRDENNFQMAKKMKETAVAVSFISLSKNPKTCPLIYEVGDPQGQGRSNICCLRDYLMALPDLNACPTVSPRTT